MAGSLSPKLHARPIELLTGYPADRYIQTMCDLLLSPVYTGERFVEGTRWARGQLRDLVRGIHPPVLDNGLADALATLANGSPIPTTLTVDVPARPRPAIETIAYFCTAELLANAAKHSCASHVDLVVIQRGDTLVVRVADDGVGGAALGLGTGLTGLSQRVSTVDGRLDVVSPVGGPTTVTVELPVRA
jgi:signal transduction histidine kinase